MRYLPTLSMSPNPAVHLKYWLANSHVPVALDPALPRLPDANRLSRGVPEQQNGVCLSNALEEQPTGEFSGNLQHTFLLSLLRLGPINARLSGGYLQDQGIAAYRKAERVLYADAEMTSRFVDLYV
jgi:hypothetical protein